MAAGRTPSLLIVPALELHERASFIAKIIYVSLSIKSNIHVIYMSISPFRHDFEPDQAQKIGKSSQDPFHTRSYYETLDRRACGMISHH